MLSFYFFFLKRSIISSGKGSIMVEFFSVAISERVWYNLNFNAEGDLSIIFLASDNFCDACISASAMIIRAFLGLYLLILEYQPRFNNSINFCFFPGSVT